MSTALRNRFATLGIGSSSSEEDEAADNTDDAQGPACVSDSPAKSTETPPASPPASADQFRPTRRRKGANRGQRHEPVQPDGCLHTAEAIPLAVADPTSAVPPAAESFESSPSSALLPTVVLDSQKAVPLSTPFDYYVVVDFECTCERDNTNFAHEIIECPAVFLNARTLQIEFEFHRYVKPVERSRLTSFCTELTGIEQHLVDKAEYLDRVLSELHEFLGTHNMVDKKGDRTSEAPLFVLCTDGPWDVLNFLRPECSRKKIQLQPYWQRWVDLRRTFCEAFGPPRCGVTRMLERRGLKFEGRPHSGIDDARNIARIAAEILRAGHELTPANR